MFARVLLPRQRRLLLFPPEQRLTAAINGRIRKEVARMATKSDGIGGCDVDEQEVVAAAKTRNPSTYNSNVSRMQNLVANDSAVGWDECWKDGVTPWDLGQPTPVILDLLHSNNLPKGRILIPGCGSGHDVVAVAGPERYAIGLDISEYAVRKAQEHFSSSPNANYFKFLAADFFSWNPNQMFDLIFDYTFFCAIDPSMRSVWAEKIQDILKPDGELITLMFPVEEYEGGPPYASQVSDYEAVLHPLGFRAFSVVDNTLAIGRRKGREKLGRWKRYQSPLCGQAFKFRSIL